MTVLNKLTRWFRRPLRCEDVNQFIIDYLEGRLSPATRRRFEAHIDRCQICDAFFEQYLQTIELVREGAIDDLEVPDEIVDVTLDFLRAHYDDPIRKDGD